MRFERVAKYPDAIIPTRSTRLAAGYDFYAAEETVIPSYWQMMKKLDDANVPDDAFYILFGMKDYEPKFKDIHDALADERFKDYRPTLVPTGVKIYLDDDKSLEIYARSSLPRKNWLVVANGVGLCDADYVNTPESEGEIYVQLINLAPFPFTIHKGEKFAQGVIRQYFLVDDDIPGGERTGGFGSTTDLDNNTERIREILNTNVQRDLFNHLNNPEGTDS